MTIPVAVTTVDISHEAEPEPGAGLTLTAVASDVRAVVSTPSGTDLQRPGGGSQTITAVLLCDPVDGISHRDRVTTAEGDVYEVAWVLQRVGLGLEHTRAGLVKVDR